jgi:hypothetical protein
MDDWKLLFVSRKFKVANNKGWRKKGILDGSV